jgi:hypothetical protein
VLFDDLHDRASGPTVLGGIGEGFLDGAIDRGLKFGRVALGGASLFPGQLDAHVDVET